MKKLFYLLLLLLPALAVAQNNVDAREIIDKINRGETVTYRNATITGKLDFTGLSNRTLKPEKTYANWTGRAKTFISTVNVPLQFTNCTFTDEVLAYYSVEKENDEGGSEIYKADFNQDVLFEGCTFKGQSAFKYSIFTEKAFFAGSRFNNEALWLSRGDFRNHGNFRNAERFKKHMIQITKACPHCGIDLVSNGHNKKNGKQKYYCMAVDMDTAPLMQLPAIVKSAKKRF